ncbi:MAG TPA: NUDIX domain-containing protein [Patescibacteria group bacterium]|nr:NUDIX domain-containing protein [Patescibacteria group bacterium]
MAQFNVRATGVLLNDEGQVLLLKRSPVAGSVEHIGWEFCGGGVEHAETPEAAIAREYKEETRLKIEAMQIFNARTGDRGGPLLNLAYFCRPLSDKVTLTAEHSEYLWVPLEDLAKYNLGPHGNIDRDAFLAISAGSGMVDAE